MCIYMHYVYKYVYVCVYVCMYYVYTSPEKRGLKSQMLLPPRWTSPVTQLRCLSSCSAEHSEWRRCWELRHLDAPCRLAQWAAAWLHPPPHSPTITVTSLRAGQSEVRTVAGARQYSILSPQNDTDSGAQTASYAVGTEVLSHMAKRQECQGDDVNNEWSHTSTIRTSPRGVNSFTFCFC